MAIPVSDDDSDGPRKFATPTHFVPDKVDNKLCILFGKFHIFHYFLGLWMHFGDTVSWVSQWSEAGEGNGLWDQKLSLWEACGTSISFPFSSLPDPTSTSTTHPRSTLYQQLHLVVSPSWLITLCTKPLLLIFFVLIRNHSYLVLSTIQVNLAVHCLIPHSLSIALAPLQFMCPDNLHVCPHSLCTFLVYLPRCPLLLHSWLPLYCLIHHLILLH